MNNEIKELIVKPPIKDKYDNGNKFELNKNLPDFHSSQLILLVASPGNGKSTIILNLLGAWLTKNGQSYFGEGHFIGPAFRYDPTLAPLLDFFGNQHDDCSDRVINNIVKHRLENADDAEQDNCFIVIDDLMALPNFSSRASSSLSRLSSIYRHVLSSAKPNDENPNLKKSGGMLLVSNQRLFSSIPRNLRSTASCILLGRVNNKEEYGKICDEYNLMFGGKKQFTQMMQECHNEKYGFMCIYINGCMRDDVDGPCIFKNFNELLYPSIRYPKKTYSID